MEKIKKRKDGRYCINVYTGTVNGKPQYKSVYGKTQKEAKEKALQIKLSKAQGMNILSGDQKAFSWWADAWLRYIESKTTDDWFDTLNSRTQFFIKFFNSASIDKINKIDCEDALDVIAKHNPNNFGKPASKKTVKEYKNILERIFKFCIDNRVLTFNPVNDIKISETDVPTSIRTPLTNKEISLIWETPHVMQTACLLMIYAGLRRGELCALTWNDIDLKNKTITVNKSANLKRNGELKPPKTKSGYRTIPIPQILLEHLSSLSRDNLLVINNEGSMFRSDKVWERCFKNYIKTICETHNVEFTTTAHCLRHTYCTLLIEADIDVLTASAFLGHANVETTMKIYAHYREERNKKTVSKFDAYLSNNMQNSKAY